MLDIAKRKEFAKKIAELTDEQKQQLSEKLGQPVTTEGHQISLINTFLLFHQGIEHPTVIGGFNQWRAVGRTVKEHEKAEYIRRPIVNKHVNEETGDEDEDRFFIFYPVFDITQTEEYTETSNSSPQSAGIAKYKVINAKFASTCPTCKNRVKKGDPVAWYRAKRQIECSTCANL